MSLKLEEVEVFNEDESRLIEQVDGVIVFKGHDKYCIGYEGAYNRRVAIEQWVDRANAHARLGEIMDAKLDGKPLPWISRLNVATQLIKHLLDEDGKKYTCHSYGDHTKFLMEDDEYLALIAGIASYHYVRVVQARYNDVEQVYVIDLMFV